MEGSIVETGSSPIGEEVTVENWPVNFFPPYGLYNIMENGCAQYVTFSREDMILDNPVSVFYVYLPHDDKGRRMIKAVSADLAAICDWEKVSDKILQEWKENRLGSAEIEKTELVDLLTKVGVLRRTVDPNVVINGAPHVVIEVVEEYRWPHD